MIVVVVDSRVRVPLGEISAELADALRAEFTHKNWKREIMKKSGTKGWWSEPAVIATWREEDGFLTLPRGGFAKVRAKLREASVSYRVQDSREQGIPADIPDTRVSLWPHQRRVVDACLRYENCLARSGTGSGKTTALLALISEVKVPSLVVVHSTALMDQWIERAEAELGIHPKEIGILGDGKNRIRDLTIGTQKTVMKMAESREFRERWGLIAADEVHLFAASSFVASIDPFPARYRVGVSDDERRKDKKDFLIADVFGHVACEVTDEELIEAERVMSVEVMIVPTEFRADWYGTPENEDDDKSPDFGRLLTEMANDDRRNAQVVAIMDAELAEGRQILVFAREREHCRVLAACAAARARSGFLIGGSDYRVEFERTKKQFRAGKVKVAVGTYQACGTGIDLPNVEIGIGAAPCLSNRTVFRQGRGRVCRKPAGKTVARFYVLWDQHVFGLKHVENAARWNPDTFVWHEGEWLPARQFLKRARALARQEA